MINNDIFVAEITGTTVIVTDHFAVAKAKPPLDSTTQDYEVISSTVVPGTSIQVTFSRLLDTGDVKDFVLVPGSAYTWSYAKGTAGQGRLTTKHASRERFNLTFGIGVDDEIV
jgi:hypothetical protein